MRLLWILFALYWPVAGWAQSALETENRVLKARIAQLEALLEGGGCAAGSDLFTGDVAQLLAKLGAQEEAHALALLGLSNAPRVFPDSVMRSVVPGEYLLLTGLTPEALGLSPDAVLFRYDQALDGFAARLSDLERDALQARGDVEVVANGRVFAAGSHGAASGDAVVAAEAAEVEVFLFDTGIRAAHRSLSGRVDDRGFTSFDNGLATDDCSGHGTHVAARIAGRALGVSARARLVSVKVMDAFGGGDVATVVAGIDWVMAQDRTLPAVVNMSLAREHEGGTDPLEIAIDRLLGQGVVVVVAAGNQSRDVARYSPARVAGAITVGSVGPQGLSSFSNAGAGVDIYAPGEAVVSASIRDVCGLRDMSGTSMAAPYVTGLVAEMLADGMAADKARDALRARARVEDFLLDIDEPRRWILDVPEGAEIAVCGDR